MANPLIADRSPEYLAKLSTAASALEPIDPHRRFFTPLFSQLNRLGSTSTVILPLFRNDPMTGSFQTLLQLRPAGEVWGGLWGIPASALNAHETKWEVAQRMVKPFGCEISLFASIDGAEFYMDERNGERGSYYHYPHYVEASPMPDFVPGWQWWDVDTLPPAETCVPHHFNLALPPVLRYLEHRALYESGRSLQRFALGLDIIDQTKLREQIAAALKYVQGRTLGPMYSAVAPLVINDSIELGIIRRVGDDLQAYMVRRDALNPRFPQMWHFPGLQQWPGESDAATLRRGIEKKYKIPLRGQAALILRENPTPEDEADDGGIHINCHLFLVTGDQQLPENETHGWFQMECLPQPGVRRHARWADIFANAYRRFEKGGLDAIPLCQTINL